MPLKVPADLHTESFYLGDFSLAMKLIGDHVGPGGRKAPHLLSFALQVDSIRNPLALCIFAKLYLGYVLFTKYHGKRWSRHIYPWMVNLLCKSPAREMEGQLCISIQNVAVIHGYGQTNAPSPDYNLRNTNSTRTSRC